MLDQRMKLANGILNLLNEGLKQHGFQTERGNSQGGGVLGWDNNTIEINTGNEDDPLTIIVGQKSLEDWELAERQLPKEITDQIDYNCYLEFSFEDHTNLARIPIEELTLQRLLKELDRWIELPTPE